MPLGELSTGEGHIPAVKVNSVEGGGEGTTPYMYICHQVIWSKKEKVTGSVVH